MGRYLQLCVLLLLVSCGGGKYTAPRDLDNACAILAERPKYYDAMKASEARWGVPLHVQMAVIYQESKFIGNARTSRKYALGIIPAGRRSTAYGYSQALDGTWDDYRKQADRPRAKRNRIEDATDFIGWYMKKSEQKLGLSLYDAASQYLAYHEGHGGYARGSHLGKGWLLRVSAEVAKRADIYQRQLIACDRL